MAKGCVHEAFCVYIYSGGVMVREAEPGAAASAVPVIQLGYDYGKWSVLLTCFSFIHQHTKAIICNYTRVRINNNYIHNNYVFAP